MLTYLFPSIAAVVVAVVFAWLADRTVERVLAAWEQILGESEDWRMVARYYTDARSGLLTPPEPAEPEPREREIEGAEALFYAWWEMSQWGSEEQATHVRTLWRVATRMDGGPASRADALRELRALGAPLPERLR